VSKRLLIVIAFAAAFRVGAFFCPHSSWDQLYYSSLAMKLDTGGFKDYNLQEVALKKVPGITASEIYREPDDTKTVIGKFKKKGFTYYDEPLFYEPPLFPYLLKFAHDIFAPHQKYLYMDLKTWKQNRQEGGQHFYGNPFYTAIVPMTFSFLAVILVFLFCSKYINEPTAFYAGVLLAVSPVNVMTATKIWTDSTGLFFYCATLFAFYIAYKKDKDDYFSIIYAGVLCALAVMARISNLNIFVVLFMYRLYLYKGNFKKSPLGFIDRKALIFAGLFLFLTFPWFSTVTSVFGSPLHMPYQKNFDKLFAFVNFEMHRPWYTYIVDIIVQNPGWAMFFLLPFFPLESALKSLLLIWAFVPLVILSILPKIMQVPIHDIYALPVYPAFSIGSGYVLYKMTSSPGLRTALFTVLILCSVLWSMFVSFKFTYSLCADCISFPF
jgi:4-amino-4-deoxy-L-arabinose transferase-like glycosyltransferase